MSIRLTQNNTPQAPEITITNIYAPNSPTKEYFTDLPNWFLIENTKNHIIGEDVNTTVNDTEDRQTSKINKPTHNPPHTSTSHYHTSRIS